MLEELNKAVKRADLRNVGRFLLGEGPSDIEANAEPPGEWVLANRLSDVELTLEKLGIGENKTLTREIEAAVEVGAQLGFLAGMRAGTRLVVDMSDAGDTVI